jgi:hypothetical protein
MYGQIVIIVSLHYYINSSYIKNTSEITLRMLEKAIADIQLSITREERYSVEAVALILDMARGCYDPNTDDSTTQLNDAQSRLKEILAGSNAQITEYISLLQKKDIIRFHEEGELFVPTDRGLHFLQIYHMLASLLM